MNTIYVLKLENNKYYVGRSKNFQKRIDTHFNGKGSAWTIRYKPIDVLKIIPDVDNFDEDKYTLMYMNQYGIDNVRGGSFCQEQLSEECKFFIKKILLNATDKCFVCGDDTHYANTCRWANKKEIKNNDKDDENENDEDDNEDEDDENEDENIIQTIKNKVYNFFKNIINFNNNENKEIELQNILEKCSSNNDDVNIDNINPNNIKKENKNGCLRCSRCGRNSHMVDNCYAKTHLKGFLLY